MNASYAMNLGGTVVRFDCDPARLAPVLEWWFDRPSATAAPHLAVALSLVPHPDRLDIPNTLLRTKTLDGTGGFDIHDGLFSGRLDRAAGRAVVRAKAALAQGQLKRVLEQIMYQAYYSARDLAGKQDVLLHSSAVIADGRGFLFVGPSEAGKSTAVVNSAQYHVLGDEMTLVRRTADGFVIEGTPFNGSFREKAPGQAPLTAVFLLARAPHHRVCDMEPGEATAAIAAEVVPMVGLDQVPGADTVPAMVETAAALVESVPVHRLELLPDPGFWREINRVFG